MKKVIALAAAISFSASSLFAGEVNTNNVTTFQSGQPALASEVNSTFSALISAINDNAARIAALENGAPTSSVAGKTFHLRSLNSMVAVGENPNDGDGQVYDPNGFNDFANISNGALTGGTLSFDSTGSNGTLTIEAGTDKEFEVNIPANQIKDFTDTGAQSDTFTFVQSGSTITITFSDNESIEFLVSGDGSLLVGGTTEFGPTTFDDGSTGESSYVELLIGVRTN